MSRVLVAFGGSGRHSTSGAERMAWRTTHALMRRGHQVVTLTDALPPPDLGAAWPAYPSAKLLPDPGAWRPDVVHAYDLAAPDYVRRALELATLHGTRFVLTPASAAQVWPDPALAAEALRAASTVYVLTEAEAAEVRKHGAPADRVKPIPSAPDLVGTADPEGFRRRYRITGPVVLFLGRRVPGKGYHTLLSAAPLVWRQQPEAVLVLAGPPSPAALPLPGPGEVRDLGLADDRTKHDALAAADVLCLPTTADVFPLVFLEAWACQRPVVCGDFPGVESVVRDGVDGIVVPATPDRVAEALLRLLADPPLRHRLGSAGRARVGQEATWERVAAAVETGYGFSGGNGGRH